MLRLVSYQLCNFHIFSHIVATLGSTSFFHVSLQHNIFIFYPLVFCLLVMTFLDYILHGYSHNATWVNAVSACVMNMQTTFEKRPIFSEILDFVTE
jgi:hypothetical protein